MPFAWLLFHIYWSFVIGVHLLVCWARRLKPADYKGGDRSESLRSIVCFSVEYINIPGKALGLCLVVVSEFQIRVQL